MKKLFLGFSSMLCILVLSGCYEPPRDEENLLIGDWHCGYKINYKEELSFILDDSGWGKYEFRDNDEVKVKIDDYIGIGTYSYSNNIVNINVETYVQHQWEITHVSEDENQFLAVEKIKNYTCNRLD